MTVVFTFALAGVAHAYSTGSPGAASVGDPLFPGHPDWTVNPPAAAPAAPKAGAFPTAAELEGLAKR